MLSFDERITSLELQLNNIEDNYADSFKTDILLFIGDFNILNPYLKFLNNINSQEEIIIWINKLTSRIVMKEDDIELNDIIFDYIQFG